MRRAYADLVASAADAPLWDAGLRQQIYLGDEAFVARMQAKAAPQRRGSIKVPKAQSSAPMRVADWLAQCPSQEEALRVAHTRSGMTMTAIAAEVRLSVGRVSQLIKRAERWVRGLFDRRDNRPGLVAHCSIECALRAVNTNSDRQLRPRWTASQSPDRPSLRSALDRAA